MDNIKAHYLSLDYYNKKAPIVDMHKQVYIIVHWLACSQSYNQTRIDRKLHVLLWNLKELSKTSLVNRIFSSHNTPTKVDVMLIARSWRIQHFENECAFIHSMDGFRVEWPPSSPYNIVLYAWNAYCNKMLYWLFFYMYETRIKPQL